MMRWWLLLIMASLVLHPAQAAEDTSPSREQIWALLEKVKKDADRMSLPTNSHTALGTKAAQDAFTRFQAETWQQSIEAKKQQLSQRHLGPGDEILLDKQRPTLSPQEKLYLFLSSSVPSTTINTYLATIAGSGSEIVPVMFGFVGGLSQTKAQGKFFGAILQKDADCRDQPQQRCPRLTLTIKIEPLLFKRYGITRVPALVYDRGGDVVIVEGDAGLTGLLARIGEEVKSPGLTGLIKTIQATN
jgi:conjugal transfer pilus assembly protein TrbC